MQPSPPKMTRRVIDSTSTSNSHVSEIESDIRQCLNPIYETLNNLPTISFQLTTAITNLHQMLEQKLERIAIALERSPSSLPSASNRMSNQEVTNTVPSTMNQLRELKNNRYDSVDKKLMNATKHAVYSEGLQQTPQFVPHKLHEKMLPSDNDAMKKIRLKQTTQNVELEIEKLQLHQTIHANKITKIDEKAHDMISKISDVEVQQKVSQNWFSIIQRHEQNLTSKWQSKANFLKSDRHMIKLGSCSYQTKTIHQNSTRREPFNTSSNNLKINSSSDGVSFYQNSSCDDVPMSYSEAVSHRTVNAKPLQKKFATVKESQNQKNFTRIPRPPRPKRLQYH